MSRARSTRLATSRRRSVSHTTRRDAIGAALETLERRVVMCALHQVEPPVELRPDLVGRTTEGSGPEAAADIVWINRGQTGDGFAATFGANAETARRVIDQMIIDFERMIGTFNYGDGSSNFNLTVTMNGGNGNGANAQTPTTLGGKPKSGVINMGRGGNGLGSGWFIDPTPADDSEFTGSIVNAFSGDAQAGSPASGLGDFYTVAAAETTHVLGLFGNSLPLWSSKTTNTFVPDTAEGNGQGTFYVFRGNSIKHLLTSNNAGSQNWGSAIHAAGPGVTVNFAGDAYVGSQDIGNAIYEFSRRYKPNRAFALMFKDAFGYGTEDPSKWGTFYAMRDPTSGTINVRGTGGADHITVSVSGNTLSVSVDPKADVPGTGHLAGNGDVAAFVTEFDLAQVSGLVINAAEGNDVLTIDALPAGLSVTVNADAGNDTINVNGVPVGATLNVFAGSGDDTFAIGGGDVYNNLPGTLNLDGQSGTDTVLFDDSATTDVADYTIDPAGFVKTGFAPLSVTGAEGIGVKANNQNNVIRVTATGTGRPVRIEAGGGDDTIHVAAGVLSDILAMVTVDGQAGNDTVNVDDSATASGQVYFVNGMSVTRGGFGGTTVTGTETFRLLADAGNSIIVVDSTSAGVDLMVNGGAGFDTITLEETNPASPVSVEASIGPDTVNVNTDASGSSAVRFVSGVTRLNNLNIGLGGSAAVVPGADKVVVLTGSLILNAAAKLDLADNALVLDYAVGSPLTNVRNWLTSGYAGGAWNGNGINSSVAAADASHKQALGYAEASDLFGTFPATFAGVEVDNTAVLVRHTIYGDTNLDQSVNLTDFNKLAAKFGTTGGWSQGNLNYDATINLADFNLLAGNFGTSLSPATTVLAPPTPAASGVPEVATVGTTKRGSKRTA